MTSPERFQRIKEHFLEAVELPPAGRAAYLDALFGQDAPLRQEIEELLHESEVEGGFELEGFPPPATESEAPAPKAAPRGSIGGYRIIRPLGRGGMGAVFEAEQSAPRRRVALKVIRTGLAGPEACRRFQLEAEILGRLEHDGIARIFEAGVDDGVDGAEPYIAMELVEGVDLASYVRDRRPTARAVLELLESVARAIAHAHHRGIIHRDLKPANILVSAGGFPKILDFGISRLTEGAKPETPPETHAGQILGTLAYMSPEQAGAVPGEVDIRSDVYSLGVIAYEVLAGKLPCELPRATISETIDAIRDAEPAPLGDIAPGLDHDVQVIVHHALEKDRSRRYESAAAFADDLRRHLDDLPIAARPASVTYQARKFARRHRVLVGGVIATILALVGGIAATAREAWLKEEARAKEVAAKLLALQRADDALRAQGAAEAARSKETTARHEAEDRLEEALAVRKLLQQTIAAARAEVLGRDVKVVDALAHAASAVSKDFGDRPLVQASVRIALGKTYDSLGMRDEARSHLERALELRLRELDEEHILIAEARRALGVTLTAAGEFERAEELITQSAAAYRRKLPANGEYFASTLADLATVRTKRGNRAGAAVLYPEILSAMRDFATPESGNLGITFNNYGLLLRDLGRFDEAVGAFNSSLEALEKSGLGTSSRAATTKGNFAGTLQSLERFAESEALYRDAIALLGARGGASNDALASFKAGLAGVLTSLGRFDEALELAQDSLDARRSADGGRSYLVGHSLEALSHAHAGKGELEEAERLMREAVATYAGTIGASTPLAIRARSQLAGILLKRGKPEEALEAAKAASAAATASLGEQDPARWATLRQEGMALAALGQHPAAVEKLREGLQRVAALFGDAHQESRQFMTSLIQVLGAAGRDAEANEVARRLASAATSSGGAALR